MKIDLKKIQDLQKSGQKYNRNDITISGCLLMLKVEGYDVSFIKSYDDLVNFIKEYNIVYEKNLEGKIKSDLDKAVKEGISINKELLDNILAEYDKYLTVKQVKEKIRDALYDKYKTIKVKDNIKSFTQKIAEEETNHLDEKANKEELQQIIKEEIDENLNPKEKRKTAKQKIIGRQRDIVEDINKNIDTVEDLLRETIDPEREKELRELLKKYKGKKEEIEKERQKIREEHPDLVKKIKEDKEEIRKANPNLVKKIEEDRQSYSDEDSGLANIVKEDRKRLLKEIWINNPDEVEKLINNRSKLVAEKVASFRPDTDVLKLRKDINDVYYQVLEEGNFDELKEKIKDKIGIVDETTLEEIGDIIDKKISIDENRNIKDVWEESKKENPDLFKKINNSVLGEGGFIKSIEEIKNERFQNLENRLIENGISEEEATIISKRIYLRVDNFLNNNNEEMLSLTRDKFEGKLSNEFMKVNGGFNITQELNFRKYRDFMGNTFYPEGEFFKSINTPEWLEAYKGIKSDLLDSGLKLPYEMREVSEVDNFARSFENPTTLQQATRQQRMAQFWNNFHQRTGGVFENFGPRFQGGFNNFTMQARNGIGGAFRQFFGQRESGVNPFVSGLKNIGSSLGQGAQNGARNILQGVNNGLGSMLKGLGGKLGGVGKLGAKGGTGAALKGGAAVAKGIGALFASGGGWVIGIVVIVIFVFILVYSMSLNQDLTSSLVPNAYGGQVDGGDEGGGGGKNCYVIKNNIKLPIFDDYSNNDICGTNLTNKKCNYKNNLIYPEGYCSSSLSYLGYSPSADNCATKIIPQQERCYMDINLFDLYKQMYEDAKEDGINVDLLQIDWGYRSYYWQEMMKQHWTCQGEPQNAATPGKSGHQSGRALDFRLNDRDNDAYRWLSKNAEKYGFYECGSGKLPTCQLSTEPWHWEYRFVPSSSDKIICGVDKETSNWVAFDDMKEETQAEQNGDRRIRPLYDAEEKASTFLKPVPTQYLTGGRSSISATKTNVVCTTKEECNKANFSSVSDLIRYDERIDKYMKGFLDELTNKVDDFNKILKEDGKFQQSTVGYSDRNIDANKKWECSKNDFKILLFYRDLKWQSALWCQDPVFTAFPGESAHMTGRVFDLVIPSSTRCIGYPKIFNEVRQIAKKWGFYATEYDTPDPDLCKRIESAKADYSGDCETDVLWEWWHWEYNPPLN